MKLGDEGAFVFRSRLRNIVAIIAQFLNDLFANSDGLLTILRRIFLLSGVNITGNGRDNLFIGGVRTRHRRD